jgi:hypothetical protein
MEGVACTRSHEKYFMGRVSQFVERSLCACPIQLHPRAMTEQLIYKSIVVLRTLIVPCS